MVYAACTDAMALACRNLPLRRRSLPLHRRCRNLPMLPLPPRLSCTAGVDRREQFACLIWRPAHLFRLGAVNKPDMTCRLWRGAGASALLLLALLLPAPTRAAAAANGSAVAAVNEGGSVIDALPLDSFLETKHWLRAP